MNSEPPREATPGWDHLWRILLTPEPLRLVEPPEIVRPVEEGEARLQEANAN